MADDTEPIYAAREIQHVIPVDGFDHELEGCVCHPQITEEGAFVAATGIDELGVKTRGKGALYFTHNKLADTSRYQLVDEEAEWEDES